MDFSDNIMVEWIERAVDFALENKKVVISGALALILGSGGMVFYRWHATSLAQQAHKTLIETLQVFEAPIQKVTDKPSEQAQFHSATEKWTQIASLCADAHDRFKRTTLAPFFLVYQAEALLNLKKHDEALPLLQQAQAQMRSQPLKDFMNVKVALVGMDCSAQALQQEGFLQLKRLAENADHTAHEFALYNLGLYFWNNKEFAQAKNYWQQMLVKYAQNDARSGGAYTELVKQKLALITVEN